MRQATNISTAITLFCLTTALVFPTTQLATRSETLAVNPGDNLEVVVGTGDIQVSTWEKQSLLVNALGSSQHDLSLLRVRRLGGIIRVDLPDGARLELRVPSQLNLDLSTGGGNIEVQGRVQANVAAESGGGEIRVGEVVGEVQLATAGGNIRVGKVDGQVNVETAGGNVYLDSATGSAELSTAGGNIEAGNVGQNIQAETAGGNVNVGSVGGEAALSTAGGNIQVGQVSAGASLETAGGDIELAGATGHVSASTAGGNIGLRRVSGSVEADTAGGNVSAELNPAASGTSSIESAGGDLTLFVPASARATIEARVEFGGGRRRGSSRNDIHSDFPTASYEKDEPGGEISATVVLNGGGHRIRLETADGSIYIRKLDGR